MIAEGLFQVCLDRGWGRQKYMACTLRLDARQMVRLYLVYDVSHIIHVLILLLILLLRVEG